MNIRVDMKNYKCWVDNISFSVHRLCDFRSFVVEAFDQLMDGQKLIIFGQEYTKYDNIAISISGTVIAFQEGYSDIDGEYYQANFMLFLESRYDLPQLQNLFYFAVEGGAGISDIRLTKQGVDPR
jgi:hypothetical protein